RALGGLSPCRRGSCCFARGACDSIGVGKGVASMRIALTIAGSDSGGGAGIQADLRAFAAFGVFGTSAITALTAQNTLEVRGVLGVDPAFVRLQVEAVLDDMGADAVKTGMLANAAIVREVAAVLRERRITALVVDPVMVA